MIWVGFIIKCLLLLLQVELRNSKLVFLQYIFRHGDRAPVVSYPGDLTPPDFWPEGYGKLTPLGKRQHYELGKLIRNMYKDFITSNPNEVLLNSTDLERCFQSGLSHIAALYAPTEEWKFEDDLNWQPIPIHYIPHETDKYLGMYSECPQAFKELDDIFKTPLYLQIVEKYKPMLQELSKYIGRSASPFEAFILSDTLFVEKLYNRPLPGWASLFYNQLEEMGQMSILHLTGSKLLHRLRMGPLIGKMIEDMKKKLAGEIPQLKVQVYSAQFEHLLVFLHALGVYNNLTCNYCATVLLELHELPDSSPAVRLLYLNSTTPEKGFQEPYVLTMDGCSEYCPLDFFVNYTKDLIPVDWERECGLKK